MPSTAGAPGHEPGLELPAAEVPRQQTEAPRQQAEAPRRQAEAETRPVEALVFPPGFKPVRGVHLSAWVAGSPHSRKKFLDQLSGTFINAVVVPLKETDGQVYVAGVPKAQAYGTTLIAIPDPVALVADIHGRGLRAIARIVVFKDNLLARKHPELAVKHAGGGLWRNNNGITWVDPYRREIWDYNLELALAAVRLGFDEIQFDYVRFPSDGDTTTCRYSREDHTEKSAVANILDFLRFARKRLEPTKVAMSIAVFGMTTTARDDMGIGQDLLVMTGLSDFVSPMMYPSHYAHGEYGLRNPNREPYKVIFRGLRDAKRRLGAEAWKLRPYLQDFSLFHVHYGPSELQAELMAAQKQGIESFILWNPANHYTWQALRLRNDSPLRYASAPPSAAGH